MITIHIDFVDGTEVSYIEGIELLEKDLGFNTNIGTFNGIDLDYEIYMLPTNKPNEFMVTEINSL